MKTGKVSRCYFWYMKVPMWWVNWALTPHSPCYPTEDHSQIPNTLLCADSTPGAMTATLKQIHRPANFHELELSLQAERKKKKSQTLSELQINALAIENPLAVSKSYKIAFSLFWEIAEGLKVTFGISDFFTDLSIISIQSQFRALFSPSGLIYNRE